MACGRYPSPPVFEHMKNAALLPGHATRAGTEDYVRTCGADLADGHYSDFLNLHLKLSSLGLGTFPGAASDEVDESYAQIVARAIVSQYAFILERSWLAQGSMPISFKFTSIKSICVLPTRSPMPTAVP